MSIVIVGMLDEREEALKIIKGSSLSVEGGALHDPEADKTFIDELKKSLDLEINIVEVDTDINHPEFARAVVESLQETLKHK